MKARSLVAVLLLLGILAFSTLLSDDSDADSNPEYILQGKTYLIGNMGLEPLSDVKVSMTIDGLSIGTAYSDIKGQFSFELSSKISEDATVELTFAYSGYSVFATPDCMTSVSGEVFSLDYNSILSGRVYDITPSDDTRHYILMGSAETPVSISVLGSGTKLQKASVTMTNIDSNDTYIGYTSDKGVAEFTKVKIGTYYITVECNGFKEYKTTLEITRNGSNNFTLELTEKGATTIFGMVSYHFMMFIGIILGLIFALIGYLLCINVWRPTLDSEDLQE